MSQTVIPLEFEQYLQNKVSLGQPTDLNEIIFAMIPDLDLSQPVDRSVTLPPQGQWVHQQDVDQTGKSGSNAVVYSVVIPGSTAPFTFNAMFLRDRNVPDSCAMVVYKATETKETGMALTKSMLMQFDGAADAAKVTMDAATWQIDYQARLKGMDEDHRLHCLDNYGHTAFIDGFAVTRHDVDQTKYLIAPGVVYLGGLRVRSAAQMVQTVSDKPITLWLDAYRDGTALSTHENLFQVIATNDGLTDYTDAEGREHYVAELARVEADGSVVDLRAPGGVQMAPWDATRVYRTGEICTRMIDGQIRLMQMYAGPNMLCVGKDPADPVNRHVEWPQSDAPFWWIEYKADITGMPFFWLDTDAPEWAVMEINVDLPTKVYWRLAERYPHLVTGELINTGEIRGEFLRVLDQGRGVDTDREIGTHQAASRNFHTARAGAGGAYGAAWVDKLGDWTVTGRRENVIRNIVTSGNRGILAFDGSNQSMEIFAWDNVSRNTARPMAIAI